VPAARFEVVRLGAAVLNDPNLPPEALDLGWPSGRAKAFTEA
jgi:hypothetical protein